MWKIYKSIQKRKKGARMSKSRKCKKGVVLRNEKNAEFPISLRYRPLNEKIVEKVEKFAKEYIEYKKNGKKAN